MPAPSHRRGLRTVATVEATKGIIVLVAGFGLLALLGHTGERAATHLVASLHLNPAHRYPHIFIEALARLDDARLWGLASLAALYSSVRFIEAYGLWHARVWAEWLAALSGGIYVPFEIHALMTQATWWKAATLIVNLAIVGYMVWLLTERLRLRHTKAH